MDFDVHVPVQCTVETQYLRTRSLGPINFVCYIMRYFVISVVNKQYKTEEIYSLGPEKLVRYIRYFVINIRSLYIEFPLYLYYGVEIAIHAM